MSKRNGITNGGGRSRMSRHVSRNADVSLVTGGYSRVVGHGHVSRRQALEEHATNLALTATSPDVGRHRKEGRKIKLTAIMFVWKNTSCTKTCNIGFSLFSGATDRGRTCENSVPVTLVGILSCGSLMLCGMTSSSTRS